LKSISYLWDSLGSRHSPQNTGETLEPRL